MCVRGGGQLDKIGFTGEGKAGIEKLGFEFCCKIERTSNSFQVKIHESDKALHTVFQDSLWYSVLDNSQFQAVHTKVKNMIIVFFLHRQCDGKCTLCNSAREAISTDDNDEDDECDNNDD